MNVYPRNASAFVTWQSVEGATGYVLQWKSGSQNYSDATRRAVVSSGHIRQAEATSLTNSTAYTFRVYATKSGVEDGVPSAEATATPSTSIDYDLDGGRPYRRADAGAVERDTVGPGTGTAW